MVKEARLHADLTQDELAEKSGTKKSYISRIENGRSDIMLTTLFKIIESGLGGNSGQTDHVIPEYIDHLFRFKLTT